MKPFYALVALALTLALPACVIIDADEGDVSGDFERTSSRTVQGALVEADTVSIWVRSNGCTSQEDFSFNVDRKSGWFYSVEFRRMDPDNCRAAATTERLTWSFGQLNIPAGSQVSVEHAVSNQS